MVTHIHRPPAPETDREWAVLKHRRNCRLRKQRQAAFVKWVPNEFDTSYTCPACFRTYNVLSPYTHEALGGDRIQLFWDKMIPWWLPGMMTGLIQRRG